MIQSMTGYGKATVELPDKKINVEIKSLNSKAMDLSARIAPLYREKAVSYTHLDVYKRQGYLMGCIGFLALQHLFFEVVVGY